MKSFGMSDKVKQIIVQSMEASRIGRELHIKMIESGYVYDGMDGYIKTEGGKTVEDMDNVSEPIKAMAARAREACVAEYAAGDFLQTGGPMDPGPFGTWPLINQQGWVAVVRQVVADWEPKEDPADSLLVEMADADRYRK
jgi:hypothetical protein